MLQIHDRDLDAVSLAVLDALQDDIDEAADYASRVAAAKKGWDGRASSVAKKAAFAQVRATLATMCVGSVRCAYCEDSLADEIEHVKPKNVFPELVFRWPNYVFACGPCNGPKNNRYGVVVDDIVQELIRRKNEPPVPPPKGRPGLIDPRTEDPTLLLELDLGGVTPEHQTLRATYNYQPADGLNPGDKQRADFTIDLLGLNREVIRAARENAYGGFRARLKEYADLREQGVPADQLGLRRDDLLRTPHLTVFFEMRRQRAVLPDIDALLDRAPEAAAWPLVVPPFPPKP